MGRGIESGREAGRPWDIGERTFAFALDVVRLCRLLDGRTGVGRTLGAQLLRAGTSIGANVEEAQAGQSRADFVSKYAIALKEAREARYWLRLVQSAQEAPEKTCAGLISESEQLAKIIGAIIAKARGIRP